MTANARFESCQLDFQLGREMLALADGSALLWRLKLRNIPVGERWRELADRRERQSLDGVRPFFVIHAGIALAAAGTRPPPRTR